MKSKKAWKSPVQIILEGAKIGSPYATSRELPGQWAMDHCQEWAAPAKFEGENIKIYWIFDNVKCKSEDPADYPWSNADAVQRIVQIDKDGEEGRDIISGKRG